MGLFNIFKGNDKNFSVNDAKVNLNLQKQALGSLDLRKNTLNLCLEKKGLINEKARVGVAMDYSVSMRDEYRDGLVQETVERLFPIALKFDDNGELDFWLFETGYRRLDSVNLNNFYSYIQDEILFKGYRMGGTQYAPVMKDILVKYMKEEPSNVPTFIIFITDGDNSDKKETTEIIRESAKHNIFWQFIGIGNASFDYLEKLDNLTGRVIDNTSFVKMADVKRLDDNILYTQVLGEYPQWLQGAKQLGIIR